MLAATVRVTRDLDLAEECVQEAYGQAMRSWPVQGVPARPGAWLTTVARRRALDLLRRDTTLRRHLPLLVEPLTAPSLGEEPAPEIADDRLRLVFTCCHPALAPDAQVALTLRLVCGLTTKEVARAFLVQEATMAARLTRAKKKIALARIAYRVPSLEELPARVAAVLDVVHLVLTTGHAAPEGRALTRVDLVQRALDLARLLRVLLPFDPEVAGLLALVLLTDARRDARVDAKGRLVLLEHQDRSRWDAGAIAEGTALAAEANRSEPPGRFALMAAIAGVHDNASSFERTDWATIAGFYDLLVGAWPSPVVALNAAVARGFADGPAAGLEALEKLGDEPRLATYRYLAAARADFLARLGRDKESRSAYEEALMLTDNEVERRFLIERLGSVAQA